MCKHVAIALDRSGLLQRLDPVVQGIIAPRDPDGRGPNDEHGVRDVTFTYARRGDGQGTPVILGVGEKRDWVSVYANLGVRGEIKSYRRYGYNLNERRWSYDRAPHGAAWIAEAARRFVRGIS